MNLFRLMLLNQNRALDFPRLGQIVGKLHLEPRLRRAAESLGQPNGHFGTYAGLAADDVIERLSGYPENLRGPSGGESERFQAGISCQAQESTKASSFGPRLVFCARLDGLTAISPRSPLLILACPLPLWQARHGLPG